MSDRDTSFPDALSDSEVRIWIQACNHEPARQALRQLLAYRVRGVSKPLDLTSEGEAAKQARVEHFETPTLKELYDEAVKDVYRKPDAPQPAQPDLERYHFDSGNHTYGTDGGRMYPYEEGEWVKYDDAQAHIAALTAKVERWQQNNRDTFEAMCAMRNAINEHVPMPSLEGDLLQGPENSVFCAAVAEAVVAKVEELTRERDKGRLSFTMQQADMRQFMDRADTAEARVAQFREALEFYADVSKYPAPLTGGMGALWEDCGQIARAALGGQSNEA